MNPHTTTGRLTIWETIIKDPVALPFLFKIGLGLALMFLLTLLVFINQRWESEFLTDLMNRHLLS